jgi:dolichol-phosphate mannosyltransferase
MPAELTVVVPSFNERDNVAPLVARLDAALRGIAWEVVFVDDDSPDETAALVRQIARTDRRVRCVQRLGRRGLASACTEGVFATSAPFVAVMDADLQHDERLLTGMLQALQGGDYDVVVGSRYVAGGGLGDWDRRRALISDLASQLSRRILQADLKDPMSGFFMVRREAFEAAARHLSREGFKILFDLFASSPKPLRFLELPYEFRCREHGESKLDAQVALDFVKLLINKLTRGAVPSSFVLFGFVGGVGLAVQLLALGLMTQAAGVAFLPAQAAATLLAMVFNYTLNNAITYRDQRRKGWRFATGLLSFGLICSFGLVANVGIASLFFKAHPVWWAAGVAGAVVGSVWNYAVSSALTWRKA